MTPSEELAELTSAVSTNLRRLAEKFGSIAELCRVSGVNRQQMNKYLTGENLPSLPVLMKLCAVLKVDIDHVVTDRSGVHAENLPVADFLLAVECNREATAVGHYLEITKSEIVEDGYLVAMSQVLESKGARRYKRRNKVTYILRDDTIWNYAGFVHSGRDCTMITYANTYQGERFGLDMLKNYGCYFLRKANHFSNDLIGVKSAVTAEEPGMPFAAPVYFRYLGTEIDEAAIWAKCRITPRAELDPELIAVTEALRTRVRRMPDDEVIKIGL